MTPMIFKIVGGIGLFLIRSCMSIIEKTTSILVITEEELNCDYIFSALRPVFAGAIVWLTVWQLHKRSIIKSGLNIPPGDLLVIIVMILRQVKTLREKNIPKLIETLKTAFPLKKPGLRTGVFVSDVIISAESNLHRCFVACIVFLFTAATLFYLYWALKVI